jgi:hypothetical protein
VAKRQRIETADVDGVLRIESGIHSDGSVEGTFKGNW